MRNLVLINNDTYQRETERPIRQPLHGQARFKRVPMCFPETIEHEHRISHVLLRANQAKRYYILYMSIIFKHLRVIFWHFGLENRYRLSEYEFYS